LSEPRTTVDRTGAEAWESERNRVAWNLPRSVEAAPSKPTHETARERQGSRDVANKEAKDE
jgi:hypothetical protein